MTAYATCAYPECYEKIPYEPKEDKVRARYCECHMRHMDNRLRGAPEGDLYIKVMKR